MRPESPRSFGFWMMPNLEHNSGRWQAQNQRNQLILQRIAAA
jgi:hypothetical protein